MSLTKNVLLGGSSLLAAGLIAVFSPSAAMAQATCTASTTITGNGSNAVTIAGGTNNPGILCNYVGDNAGVTALGSITVSTSGGVPANPLVNGVNLRATGADDIAWTSTAGAVSGGSQSHGPVIDARTATGNIMVATGEISVNGSTGTDGVLAQTGGAGTVTLDLRGAIGGNGPAAAAVRVTNGTGAVNIDLGAASTIRGANSMGLVIDSDGAVDIDGSGVIMGGYGATGSRPAAIVASGQTFSLTLTGDPNSSPDRIQGYRASLGGFASPGDGINGPVTGEVGLVSHTAPLYTGGHIDLSGVVGSAELNFTSRSRWVLTDTSIMSGGGDVVNLDATSVIVTAHRIQTSGLTVLIDDVDQEIIVPGIVEFGDGDDTVNNAGRLMIGPAFTRGTAVGQEAYLPPAASDRFGVRGEIRLLDLEEFNNTGEIWLGTRFFDPLNLAGDPVIVAGTDRFHDDMLYMPGATFDGGEGSAIYMDVNLAQTQSSCAPSTRDDQGYLPAADCLGLQGGAATGETELHIVEFVPGDRGSYNPDGTVLVDLAGGDPDDTETGAFIISPDTPRYADIGNGAIDKGVFAFVLGFDADDQQFKLYGIPGSGGQQLPMLATAANQLWQTATGGWFQRQVDQRDVEREDGLGTGAWFNITGSNANRDILTAIPIGTGTADFDNTYEQKDVAVTFGWDLISHDSAGVSWSLGAMVGYAQSEIDFDDSGNSANLEGVHGGVYGGLTFADVFVDAAVNATRLSLHDDVPALGLIPAGTLLDTTVQSLGVRIEAGWRWDAGVAWVEPIVGLSTVRTDFDDFRIPNDDPDLGRPGVGVGLENSESRRASLGVRVGADDLLADFAPTSLSLTARRVNEFEGGSDIVITNTGPDALVNDTFDGAFTQLTGSVGVSNASRTVSGYLNVDAVAGDDYESLGISAGLRLQW